MQATILFLALILTGCAPAATVTTKPSLCICDGILADTREGIEAWRSL